MQQRIIENMSFCTLRLTCEKKSLLDCHSKALRTVILLLLLLFTDQEN